MARDKRDPAEAKAIGLNIQRLREAKGLGQAELNRRCGFGNNTVWRYEAGRATPGNKQARKMAEVLECSRDDIYGKVGPLLVGATDEQLAVIDAAIPDCPPHIREAALKVLQLAEQRREEERRLAEDAEAEADAKLAKSGGRKSKTLSEPPTNQLVPARKARKKSRGGA